MALIKNFHAGTTKNFTINISLNGAAQNIAADTVTVTIKTNKSDADGAAVLQQNADVITDGANGNATFSLTPAMTAIAAGTYYIDIQWILSPSGAEYVVYDDTIKILERVSDL